MNTAVLAVLLACIATVVNSCGIPTRFWCDNKETATKCGVLEQCQTYEWTESADKVELVLYYESLCPDCRNFITKNLYPNYANLSAIMNLTLVPYGNANEKQVGSKWELECQHGALECQGNLIETCAIAIVRDINKYFPFINCIEASPIRNPAVAAKRCAARYPVPLADIMKCAASDYGNQLEHEMALKTDALRPPHEYVPWVTVNGVHTEALEKEAETNLVKLICDTYKGPKTAVCQ